MEKEFHFSVIIFILNSNSNFLVILEGGLSIVELKQSARKYSFDFSVRGLRIIGLFFFDQHWKMTRLNFSDKFLNNVFSTLFSKFLQFHFFFFVFRIRNIVNKIEADLHSFFLNIVAYLDTNSFELFCQNIKISLTDRIFSDKTEKACWFKFGSCSSSVAGVQLADTYFPSNLEELALILFSYSLQIILLHFILGECKIEIDVKGADKDPIIEVSFIIESFSLVVVIELNLNDSIFSIDRVLLYFCFFLAVLQEHINHFVLNSLLHILNDQLFAVLDLLLNCFLSHYLLKL